MISDQKQLASIDPEFHRNVERTLAELDLIIARLDARASYWNRPPDEEDSEESFGLLDEFVELHCTPLGVSIDSDKGLGYGVAQVWHNVGKYLRRAMIRISAEAR